MTPHRSALRRWTFALPLVGLGAFTWSFRSFTVDDAFIVARYARNLAERGELSFNPGERINALTSPGHVFLLGALHAVAKDPIAAHKLLATATLAFALSWAALACFRESRDRLVFMTLTAASPFVALWASAGLETPLLTAAIAALIGCAASVRRSSLGTGALALLAFAIRPDSLLFTVWLVEGAEPTRRSRWTARACVVAGAAGVLAAWMWHFGDPLPTSFYVKLPTTGGLWRVGKNVFYLANFGFFSGAMTFLVGRRTRSPVPDIVRSLLAGLACVGAYGAWFGSVHMMFAYRLFVPYLPAVAAAGLLGGRRFACERLMLGGVLAAHVALCFALHRSTLNPTALNLTRLGVRLADGGIALRVGSTDFADYVFEYPFESADSYADELLPALDRSAAAIRHDWATRGVSRAPAVHTFAAGKMPYSLREAYVFDALGSYRTHCPEVDLDASADYLHVMSRGFEPVDTAPGLERILRIPIRFDGRDEALDVWYRRETRANPLPPRVRDPCSSPP